MVSIRRERIGMTGCPKPNLGYEDAPAAIRFLVETLGFVVSAVYEGSHGSIAHAELTWPAGGGVALHTGARGNSIAGIVAGSGRGDAYPAFSIHIDIADPDALHSRVRKRGAVIVHPLSDSPHGTRGFVVKDPEGLYWSFGTPLPRQARSGNEWGAAPEAG
jgi:uncharacterized glyoxalase superfamily protein PhnB